MRRLTAAAGSSERRPDHQLHRARKGRGWVPHFQRRPSGHRSEVHGALHPAGLSDDAARLSRFAVGYGCSCDRPLQHRRQADGAAALGR